MYLFESCKYNVFQLRDRFEQGHVYGHFSGRTAYHFQIAGLFIYYTLKFTDIVLPGVPPHKQFRATIGQK